MLVVWWLMLLVAACFTLIVGVCLLLEWFVDWVFFSDPPPVRRLTTPKIPPEFYRRYGQVVWEDGGRG